MKNSNSISSGPEEDKLVQNHKRGHGICAFLYCNIDFFFVSLELITVLSLMDYLAWIVCRIVRQ